MNFKKEVILDLQDVQGEVKVVFSPLSFNVYHNGKKIKKKSGMKAKFLITTSSGEAVPMVIRNGKGMVRTACFKDQQIPLEEKVSLSERFIAIASIAVVFAAGFFVFRFAIVGGVIGGALIGATIGMGMVFNLAFIRLEKNVMLQILVSLGISVVAFLAYYILGMLIASALYTAVGPFYY